MKETRDYDDDRKGRPQGGQRSRSRDRDRPTTESGRRERRPGASNRKSKFDLSSPKNNDRG
jgi:hypothetical protein